MPEATFLDANELVINMGPQHPATHGVLRVKLKLDSQRQSTTIPEYPLGLSGSSNLHDNRIRRNQTKNGDETKVRTFSAKRCFRTATLSFSFGPLILSFSTFNHALLLNMMRIIILSAFLL